VSGLILNQNNIWAKILEITWELEDSEWLYVVENYMFFKGASQSQIQTNSFTTVKQFQIKTKKPNKKIIDELDILFADYRFIKKQLDQKRPYFNDYVGECSV